MVKRKKKKFRKNLFGIRGGASYRGIPSYIKTPLVKELQKVVSEKTSPKKVSSFMEKVVDKAAGGKSSTATRILKELSKPIGVKISGELLKMVSPPTSGVATPSGSPIVLSTESSWKQVSGSNGLYTAKEHRVNFVSGSKKGRWIRAAEIENGKVNRKTLDTTEKYQLDSEYRSSLTKIGGLGRKQQQLIHPNLFGWTFDHLATYFKDSNFDTSILREQIAYGAVTKLNSKLTITNLNKFVPCFIRLNLLRSNVMSTAPLNSWLDSINMSEDVQLDGAMPKYFQQGNRNAESILGNTIYVDPQSKGVKSSECFKSAFDIVESKKVKLAAGDRLKVNYDHLCGSGIRLDKLHGLMRDASTTSDHTCTYILMVECWGEEVDAYSLIAGQQGNVIKGSAPTSIQFEASKAISGIVPSDTATQMQNSGGFQGYKSSEFAIKLYSNSPLATTTRRYYNTHQELGVGYKVPVMSDAIVSNAGRIM